MCFVVDHSKIYRSAICVLTDVVGGEERGVVGWVVLVFVRMRACVWCVWC